MIQGLSIAQIQLFGKAYVAVAQGEALIFKAVQRMIIMKYIKATVSDAEQILILVQDTIKRIYPKYYSKNIADFFCELHYTLQKSRQDKTASTLFTGFRNPFIGKKSNR